jgi:hypothetical protein
MKNKVKIPTNTNGLSSIHPSTSKKQGLGCVNIEVMSSNGHESHRTNSTVLPTDRTVHRIANQIYHDDMGIYE